MTQDRDAERDVLDRGGLSLSLPELEPSTPRTAQERVYQVLRQAILGTDIAPGARLVQAEIAKALGVSTTPVREALRSLDAEGLIVLDPYRGAVVLEPSMQDVREVYELRIALTPLAVRDSIENITERDILDATRLCEEMGQTTDLGRWVDMNHKFHGIFDRRIASRRLREILSTLRGGATMMVGLSLAPDEQAIRSSDADHRQLIAAYSAGDADAVTVILESHLQATVTGLERRMDLE